MFLPEVTGTTGLFFGLLFNTTVLSTESQLTVGFLPHLETEAGTHLYKGLQQGISTFLTLRPFSTVPHAVVTPSPNRTIILFATW